MRERGKLRKVGVRCMLAHLTEFPYGLWSSLPLPLVFTFLLPVLLPVRSSLSFPSHTSPFLCTLNLAHEIYFCCFICHQKIQKWWFILLWGTFGYTPTISAYMGLNILGQKGELVPSVQCFSLERHFYMTNPFLHTVCVMFLTNPFLYICFVFQKQYKNNDFIK